MPTKHGYYKTSTYNVWKLMRKRCLNPNDPYYHRYGGRGIAVCKRWDDFRSFLEDMGEKPEGMTLDRIDSDGWYEPSNCRWAAPKEQSRNSAVNRKITINGVTKILVEWSEESGINEGTIRKRLRLGWEPEMAVFHPVSSPSETTDKPDHEAQ